MSSVVVVDDVSPVVRTDDVDRIRYRGSGVAGVPKTQHSVLLVCCVGNVDEKSEEDPRVPIFFLKNNGQEKTQYLQKQTNKILLSRIKTHVL